MSLESELATQLKGYAGLAALVAARIYPGSLPQAATLPAVTFQRVDTAVENDHQGFSGLIHPRVQVDSWGATQLEAIGVAKQVQLAMQDWCNQGKPSLWQDQAPDLSEAAETGRHRIVQDFIVWHKE